MMSQQMAIEWGPLGVRVNTVAPGMIDGGMSAPIFADPEFRRRRTEKVPSGRLGTVDDIAKAVLFLCSGEADYINGHQPNSPVSNFGSLHGHPSCYPRGDLFF